MHLRRCKDESVSVRVSKPGEHALPFLLHAADQPVLLFRFGEHLDFAIVHSHNVDAAMGIAGDEDRRIRRKANACPPAISLQPTWVVYHHGIQRLLLEIPQLDPPVVHRCGERGRVRRAPVDVVDRIGKVRGLERPGGFVRGERANFTGLVLVCIEAKFCK